jgi:hypothetical protein
MPKVIACWLRQGRIPWVGAPQTMPGRHWAILVVDLCIERRVRLALSPVVLYLRVLSTRDLFARAGLCFLGENTVFESGTQSVLSSIASCMSSRLEHDPHTAIGVQVHLNGTARKSGLSEMEIYELISLRLREAGITLAKESGGGGCALGVEVHLDYDGLCLCGLEFFRVQSSNGRASSRPARGGAWRLTLMAHAETGESIRNHLRLLASEFIRQYMEAN